jgi:hypothetical protein
VSSSRQGIDTEASVGRGYTAGVEQGFARRRARAALTASALAVLTVAGHTAGGGSVDVLGLSLVVVLSFGLGMATSARSPRLPQLLAVLVAGQGLLHLVLTFTTGHSGHEGGGLPASAMVGGHLIAAAVAAVAIRHADRLLDRWAVLVSTVLGSGTLRTIVPRDASAAVLARPALPLTELASLLHQVVRRGPPAGMHLTPA